MKQQRDDHFLGISRLPILVFFTLVVGLTGYCIYLNHRAAVHEGVSQQLETSANLVARQVSTWLDEQDAHARLIMDSARIARLLRHLQTTPSDARPRVHLLAWMEMLKKYQHYSQTLLFDPQGRLFFGSPALNVARDPQLQPLIDQAVSTRQVAMKDLYYNQAIRQVCLDFAVPLLNDQPATETVAGVLILRIDPAQTLYPLFKLPTVAGQTHEALIVRHEGDQVRFLSELRFHRAAPLSFHLLITADSPLPSVRAVLGAEGQMEGVDYRGEPVLAAVKAIRGTPWYLVSKIDQAEVNAAVYRHGWMILGLSALFMLVTFLAGNLLWRRREMTFFREKLHAEHERLLLAEHYLYLTQYANDIILLLDQTGRILEANERAVKSYGCSLEELRRMSFNDLLAPDADKPFDALLEQALDQDGYICESLHRHRDGLLFPVENSVRLIEIDGHRYVQCIIRDITERKQDEATIIRSRDFYLKLFEDFPTLIWRCGTDAKCNYLNKAWLEFTGRPVAEELGDGWAQGVHPEDREQCLAIFKAAFARCEPYSMEYRLRHHDGTYHWIHDISQPFYDLDGSFSGYICTCVDIDRRKRSEDDLRIYREAVENSEDMIAVLDRQLCYCIANKALLHNSGLTREKIIGLRVGGTQDSDYYRRFLAEPLSRALLGEQIQLEITIAFPKNSRCRLNVQGAPILDKDGRVKHIVLSMQDITASYELNQERDLTVSLLGLINTPGSSRELINDALALLRHYAECEAVAIRLRQGVDYPYFNTIDFPAEFVAKEFRMCQNHEGWTGPGAADPEPSACLCGRILDGKMDPSLPCFTAHGSFWTSHASLLVNDYPALQWAGRGQCLRDGYESIALVPLRVGKRILGLLQFSDKRAGLFTPERIGFLERLADNLALGLWQRITAEAHERLATVVEQVSEAIMITSTNDEIQYVNPAFERLLGYAQGEVVGLSIALLSAAEDDESFQQQLLKSGQDGGMRAGVITCRRKDGTTCQMETHVTNVHDNQGRINNYVALMRDVSQELLLEEQLRQSQKMEAMGRLAGGVAHDFNNLLTVIGGFSELLMLGLPEVSPLREDVTEIQHAADRASALTRQLLAFSRRQVLQSKVLDLNQIVDELQKMLRRLIGEDINLIAHMQEHLHPVKVDPGQIEQVIINLAVNARDAMAHGGMLLIETSNVELDESYTRHHADVTPGHYVMLSITDTGCGMSPEVRERIFEPFYTTKERGRGTGLGLSMVYGIVHQSGGHIWVYSEVGQGTSFKIYLPAATEVITPQGQTVQPAGTLSGEETLLLVEDEKAVRELTSEALRRYGYQVLEAADGVEALEVFEKNRSSIQLVIADIVMPRMGGDELAQHLYELAPELRVLFISGYTEDAIIHQGMLNPGTMYMQKPFSPTALVRKVRSILDMPVLS